MPKFNWKYYNSINPGFGNVMSEIPLRFFGLFAQELWSQQDQQTNAQIPVNDRQLILKQQFTQRKPPQKQNV